MELHGSYTFPASLERVHATLTDADALAQAIPGCERLIQLGPPTADGATIFEARVRVAALPGVVAALVTLAPDPDATHFHATLRGRSPAGPIDAAGTLALVPETDQRTVVAYDWRVEAPGLSPSQQAAVTDGAGSRFAGSLGTRLVAHLYAPANDTRDGSSRADATGGVLVQTTPRGKIISISADQSARDGAGWELPAFVAGLGVAIAAAVGLLLLRSRARRV